MKKPKIFIVIHGGCLSDVYGTQDMDVELIDLDSDDEVKSQAAGDRLEQVENQPGLRVIF